MIDLKAEMSKLPEPPNGTPPYWEAWRHNLWERAQADDAENFTKWPCIYHTMLVQFRDMTWRWDRLPQSHRRVVATLDSPLMESAIEQAYHLCQWEEQTGRHVADLDRIFELGGGYGQMAWLCRKLGFQGDYFIVDVPEFQLLQRWWLENQGIDGTYYDYPYYSPDLYIAVYSVSVMPPEEREAVLFPADSYLLAYSDHMENWDNHSWFGLWMSYVERPWRAWQMEDRPEDWYAVC